MSLPTRFMLFCASAGSRSGVRGGLRTPNPAVVSNPRPPAPHPRSSIAPWRRRRGRAVMTSVRAAGAAAGAGHGPARRHRRARPRRGGRRAPLGRAQDRRGPHRRLLPVRRARRGPLRGESGVPASRRRSRFLLSLSLPFPPQRRRVADLHQRARLPPHAAFHHVLQVSAGAAGPGPGRGGGVRVVTRGWERLCPVPGRAR